ncbi:Glutathione S-transferase 1 [Habropoda laboriosa]|uniref:Glutathione S-transferase 1 n=2 Tax=Habropoda laboriosa TaxID=597456 RepID=A0A0L7R849_9HYME|nr:PREDICTED: glutathione S-transferase 1-like isoform X2 [Habropoda laboriosa]XP_017788280.1 PREDICTED: glutathione S-transferase 1-like isoform X2 [Habropoda laboriosa]KOC67019.1 Glutathione S-transferase 1 [Habropoda laboriosa]
MSKVVLYSQNISPPCRAVLMVANAIGLTLEVHEINLANREQLSEEFIKINPQHTIPTLDDDGFILPDSHAIICYLVDKYAKDDSLYPKDLQKRALVNQFLHLDSSTLFSIAKSAIKPILFYNEKAVPEEKMKMWKESYDYLNKFLEGKKWLVGDSYTIADISCAATASSSSILVNMDEYPNVKAWLQRCEEELPGYKQYNLGGNNQLQSMIRAKLA